ncbi:hypothetical protein J132_06324 [Termitomyces sp. J132]|nr:hypothetical protein J132_06324 [Termitomyces sp. J132]
MIKQCFPAKKKGKGKAKEPEPLTAMDEQIAHLLQWLHESRVPEDVGADILDNPVVQLALAQVLNELNVRKRVATPPNPPEAKKVCIDPSVFVKGSSTQRAPLMPYDDIVPASDDYRMDKHPDFKVASSSAGPSKPVAAKVKLPKPAVTKDGMSKPSMKKAGTRQSSAIVTEADNSTVVAMTIAFLANVSQGAEADVIKVLELRISVMPGMLPQEFRPTVHRV